MARLNTVLVLLALVGMAWLFNRQCALQERIAELEHGGEAELEVAEIMGRLERHMTKWWAAGAAGNADLAAFYLHEMEEAFEELAEAGVEEEGVDVSAQVKVFGLPVIEALERRLRQEGVAAMHADAAMLVANCNGCHVATHHPYIRLREPAGVVFPAQEMAP